MAGANATAFVCKKVLVFDFPPCSGVGSSTFPALSLSVSLRPAFLCIGYSHLSSKLLKCAFKTSFGSSTALMRLGGSEWQSVRSDGVYGQAPRRAHHHPGLGGAPWPMLWDSWVLKTSNTWKLFEDTGYGHSMQFMKI